MSSKVADVIEGMAKIIRDQSREIDSLKNTSKDVVVLDDSDKAALEDGQSIIDSYAPAVTDPGTPTPPVPTPIPTPPVVDNSTPTT